MKIATVKFAVPIKKYIFSIEYSQKREINPFEYILLKLPEEESIKNENLIEFANRYLQIPLAKDFLSYYLQWLVDNEYLKINDELDITDLLIKDLNITDKGKQVLKNNFFPAETKILEKAYAINPLTKKQVSIKNLKETIKLPILDINFQIDFDKEWIKNNISQFINLNENDTLDNIKLINEENSYLELQDDLVIKNNQLISIKHNYKLPIESNINNRYNMQDFINFNINKFYADYEVDKIINLNSKIKFEKYNNTKEYKIIDNSLRIIFEAPEFKEQTNDNGGAIFIEDDFPIDDCIYMDEANNIFAVNLVFDYYNDKLTIFKYFSIKDLKFNVKEYIKNNVNFTNKYLKLFVVSKEELCKEFFDDNSLSLIEKLEHFKKIKELQKHKKFNYKNLLEELLKKEINNINFEQLPNIINFLPKDFITSSNILANIVENLTQKAVEQNNVDLFIQIYKFYKNNNLNQKILQNIQQLLIKMQEKNPENTSLQQLIKSNKKKNKRRRKNDRY